MLISRRSWLSSSLLLLFFGCHSENADSRFPQFEATTKPQRAVFLTESWTGGGGDPVQTTHHGRTQQLNGRPVYLLFDEQELIKKGIGKQPAHSSGAILVDARIRLERTSVTQSSVPGGGSKSIYRVVIEKLFSSDWYPSH